MSSITYTVRDIDYSYGNKIEVTHLALDRDNIGYYLTARFKVENDHRIKEVDVPKIRFPIDTNKLSMKDKSSSSDTSNYGYFAPYTNNGIKPAVDYAMFDDDDAQLPF